MSLYETRKNASGWVVRLTDQVDPLNMGTALEQLANAITEETPPRVQLCLDAIVQIQSSAAGRLVELKRRLDFLGIPLSITGVQPSVRETLTCMKLHQVLPIATGEGAGAPPENGRAGEPHPMVLAETNRPRVVRMKQGFGQNRAGHSADQLSRLLAEAATPMVILNFAEVESLEDADVQELIRLVELVEAKGGRCAAARLCVDLFAQFIQSGLGGRLMLYPEVGRARVALLATASC